MAWEEHVRDESFRVYLTDAVRLAAENAAHIGGGSVMSRRWAEIVENPRDTDDGRTADEIVADIAERAGLTLV